LLVSGWLDCTSRQSEVHTTRPFRGRMVMVVLRISNQKRDSTGKKIVRRPGVISRNRRSENPACGSAKSSDIYGRGGGWERGRGFTKHREVSAATGNDPPRSLKFEAGRPRGALTRNCPRWRSRSATPRPERNTCYIPRLPLQNQSHSEFGNWQDRIQHITAGLLPRWESSMSDRCHLFNVARLLSMAPFATAQRKEATSNPPSSRAG